MSDNYMVHFWEKLKIEFTSFDWKKNEWLDEFAPFYILDNDSNLSWPFLKSILKLQFRLNWPSKIVKDLWKFAWDKFLTI